jgi:hypothetical protein
MEIVISERSRDCAIFELSAAENGSDATESCMFDEIGLEVTGVERRAVGQAGHASGQESRPEIPAARDAGDTTDEPVCNEYVGRRTTQDRFRCARKFRPQ